MSCKNLVSQFIPKGYDYKEIKLPCGSTDIHGGTLLCEECWEKFIEQYPQGWRNTPGDICKHGNYVGDAYGPDYLCGLCEDGE